MTVHSQPRVSQACPALVLNADFRPLSYYPLALGMAGFDQGRYFSTG